MLLRAIEGAENSPRIRGDDPGNLRIVQRGG